MEPPKTGLDGTSSMEQQENTPGAENTAAKSTTLDQAELDRAMTELLARQRSGQGSRAEAPLRRKERKLGRAPSGNSTALSFTRPPNLETANSIDEAFSISPSELTRSENAPLPSQMLTYDAPGAEEHRRLMGLKMGMAFDDEGVSGERVGGIGVVKDAESSNIGQRLRGRHR